jgi:hypothetical protein
MDLLTTMVHEMGNAMGFPEDQGQDVAGATLQAGERRVPVRETQPLAETQARSEQQAVTGPSFMRPSVIAVSNGHATATPTIDAALMALWPTTLSGAAVAPAFIPDAGVKPAAYHPGLGSSDLESNSDAKVKIDWNRNRSSFMEKIASSNGTRDWQNDFLNHLGKDGLQRNPNAGLRVRPGVFSS